MSQTVLITGTGRPYALGFNLVKRYLEHGDCVFASVRRPSEALEALKSVYPGMLHILTMDISSTESVNAAARELVVLLVRCINESYLISLEDDRSCRRSFEDLRASVVIFQIYLK